MRSSRYAWLLGIAAIIVVAYLSIGAARPQGPGARGLTAGMALPPFAVARATSDIVCDSEDDPCDANIARGRGEGAAGSRPACEVRGPTILNVCELAERGPLVLGLAATRDADCIGAFDALERLQRRHRGLQVAVVAIGGGLEELRAIVRTRGWRFPVGWDRDGVLARLYGVVACPQLTVARWRGRVTATVLGRVAGDELERRVAGAVAASRRAGWKP